MTLGEIFKHWTKKNPGGRYVSRGKLCDLLDVTKQSMSDWCKGVTPLPVDIAIGVANRDVILHLPAAFVSEVMACVLKRTDMAAVRMTPPPASVLNINDDDAINCVDAAGHLTRAVATAAAALQKLERDLPRGKCSDDVKRAFDIGVREMIDHGQRAIAAMNHEDRQHENTRPGIRAAG